MPQNLDFPLYFNILFFSVMGIGFLIGYIRGYKKTLFALIASLIFYAFFFVTIDVVIAQLWITPIPFAFDYLATVLPDLAGEATIGGAVFSMLEIYVGDQIGDTLSNTMFVAFVTGLAQFVLKLVYTILYFTVGQILYKWLVFMLRLLVIRTKRAKVEKVKGKKGKRVKLTKKQKKLQKKEYNQELKQNKKLRLKEKKPLLGAAFGLMKGAVSAFVSLIVIGGMLNMSESLLAVISDDADANAIVYEDTLYLSAYYHEHSTNPTQLETGLPVPAELDAQITQARDMVDAFNANIFVQSASTIVVTSPEYADPIEMHLYLFDAVFSFSIEEDKVMLRNEINVFAEAGAIMLNSEYMTTQDISDITSDEIVDIFTQISKSNLITILVPLGIEVGSDYFDIPVDMPIDELYAIDWESEIMTLGAVAAVGFDLVNTAGLLDDSADLETITIDGDEVASLFNSLAESELVTLAAYVAIGPLLEEMGGEMSGIITVPTDLVWEDEFVAFGQVAKAVLDTGITVGDLQEADPAVLISALAEMDFTILLSSKIVSHALKNIFSGEAGIEGLDMIIVPDDIVWFDIFDDEGNLVTPGELRNILLAVNAITEVAGGFDFNNLDFNIISEFTDEIIDTIFDSQILVASISGFILDMDLGDTPLIIPDSVLDSNRYILSSELKAIASAAVVLVEDLGCDEGDTVCEETGFDIAKAFSLEDDSIDTLLSSDILAVTIGQLVIDSGGDMLVIPNSALTEIFVDTVGQDVASRQEIKKLFQAVSVLGFDDLDNMEFDASIVQNLGLELEPTTLDQIKSDKLFGSKIVHATLSKMLFDQTDGVDSILTVPYFDVDLNVIREYSVEDEIEYLSLDELEDILQAFLTLDITDFETVDALDLGLIIDNSTVLLESAILHATISKQVFDLGSDVVAVPYKDELANAIRVTVGDPLEETDTEYIVKSEIINILDGLEVLDITDINSFDGNIDLASITEDPDNIDTLLNSAIIHATVSDQLIKLDTDGTIKIPYKDSAGDSIRVTVGDVGFQTEYVVKDEIKAMVDSLDILGATDMDSFDGNVDLASITEDPANIDTLLSSGILHATISDQLIQLDIDESINIPYVEEDNATAVRVTVGDVGFETEYVTKDEIKAMIDALDILGIEDMDSFDGTVDLASITEEPGNMDIMLSSAIIHATVSDQLIELNDAGDILVPYVEEDNTTLVRVVVGAVGFTTEYVTKDEINAMIDALDILGIVDIESFDGTVDLATITAVDGNVDIMLASAIIHGTLSEQLIELDVDETILVPHLEEDNATLVRVTVGNPGFETEYITKVEINAMIDALDVLEITDVESFSGTVDLGLLMIDDNMTIVLSSAILQATISKQLIDLDADGTLDLPYLHEDDVTNVRFTVGDSGAGTDTEYVLKAELEALIDAMDVLGINDIETFDGTVDLSLLTEGNNSTTVLLSAMIQATISKQLIDLDTDGTINLPFLQEDNATEVRFTVGDSGAGTETEYVLKAELEAMIEAMDILEITDIETFSGSVDLSLLMAGNNMATVLASAMIQATISEQLIDLDTDGTVNLPYFKEDDLTLVRITVGTGITETEYVSQAELVAMIDAMDVLEITDIETFSGSVDLSVLAAGTNSEIVLSSAIIQATVSEQVLDLTTDPNMAATFIVPFWGSDDLTKIRISVGVY